jgi:4-hydroxythreonine-4-phosphate dehydrogenase
MASNRLHILITTGDSDGVGYEVTAKALAEIGPIPGVQFLFYRSPALRPKSRHETLLSKILRRKFYLRSIPTLQEALDQPPDQKLVVEIQNEESPASWVEQASRAAAAGQVQALVTAPLSKTCIRDSGLKDIGHTEILSRISGRKNLFMGFLGSQFSVVLATGHLATAQAIANLNEEILGQAIAAADQLRALLPKPRRKLPLAVVGVNPHASEEGLIGKEDLWIQRFLQNRAAKVHRDATVSGPLVPDAAYRPAVWKKHSVYVAPYHDQGLIPFKLVHGVDEGVHITLGLPFVRTSVDHGCAKDIFGQNKAKHGSMRDAILLAVRMAAETRKVRS